jgi:hypothetical protein
MIPPAESDERWLHDVYRPTLARIAAAVGPDRDLVQAYCDVLEEKWFMSERAGRDIGLEAAIQAYLAMGAPAPEQAIRDDAEGLPDALDPLDLASGDPLEDDQLIDADGDGDGGRMEPEPIGD